MIPSLDDALLVKPGLLLTNSYEQAPISIEMAPMLEQGDSVAEPTAHLIREADKTEYAAGIVTGPSNVGTVVTLKLAGLEPGTKYRLILPFLANAGQGKRLAPYLFVECRY